MNGWTPEFVRRFNEHTVDEDEDAVAIATLLTRDNREFRCRPGEIEVLDSFPTAVMIDGVIVIPESEIVRIEVLADDGRTL